MEHRDKIEKELGQLKGAWFVTMALNLIMLIATLAMLYQTVSLNRQLLEQVRGVAAMVQNWPPGH